MTDPAQSVLPFGLVNNREVFWNLSAPALVETALARGEGILTDRGALAVTTGKRTGRSPKDRFVVRDASTEKEVWWGPINLPIEPDAFGRLLDRVRAYLQGRSLFVHDAYTCADPRYRLPLRVVTENAWHALFAHCLFRRLGPAEFNGFRPEWTVLHAPGLENLPGFDATHSEVLIAINFEKKLVVITGTHYAGEIKKSIFTALNGLLPGRDVFPMHCAANVGAGGDVALFFGLSGTGKTTLSADPDRRLIGDDEHGWSAEGVFNLEGGCYAKTIRLSPEGEPQIWDALRFGSVLENVVVDPRTRVPDFDSDAITENTRAAYPLDFIPNYEPSGRGGHPRTIFFLTCDAFGVLPPIARLTPPQAMYHFLSGYTAKVAGTEAGVTEPAATFSACFGAPFLPLHPTRYAEMLRRRLDEHRTPVWLVNTGWTGGPVGAGRRIKLAHTRALLKAALEGTLDRVSFRTDPVFGLAVPESCPGVPPEILRPRDTWPDPSAYDAKASKLAGMIRENFEHYAGETTDEVRRAGPPGGSRAG